LLNIFAKPAGKRKYVPPLEEQSILDYEPKKGGVSQRSCFMRKTIVTAFFALLVMLTVTSCDSIIPGLETEKAEYTADGRKLVTLKVNISGTESNNRSLLDDSAKGTANYAEVVFVNDSKYYRAGGYLSGISVKVPAGTYNATNAIILIGRKSDGTLLATGTLDTDFIVPSDPKITFTVSSLVTDLNANTSSTFAFKIEEAFPASTPISGTTFANKTSTGKFDEAGHPCFQVPPNKADIRASLTINGFATTGTNIKVADNAKVTFSGIPEITVLSTTITPASGTAVGPSGKFGFDFDTGEVGEYIITFKIPVVGFSSANGIGSTSHIWYIRGGIKTDGNPDFSKNDEEGVALLVTESPDPLYIVPIEPNYP